MNKNILFSFLLFSFFNVAAASSELSSDTKIGLTLSRGQESGRVEATYEVLQHSEVLKKMFASGMLENFLVRFSKSNVVKSALKLISVHFEPFKKGVEQIINIDSISLDEVLEPIYKKLTEFGVEDFFEPQDLLNVIVAILGCLNRQEDLVLNKLKFEEIFHLLFVGDVLQIEDLVDATISILAKNITRVKPAALLCMMFCDEYNFSTKLAQIIIEKNYDLFFPINICESEATLEGHAGYINSAEFSKKGKKVVTSSMDKTSKVWFVGEDGVWECEATLEGHTRYIHSAEFSHDEKKIVTASVDTTAKVWGVDDDGTWECVATLRGHSDWVRSAKFSFDETKIVTASGDTTAKVWVVGEYGVWDCVATLEGHFYEVYFAEFSLDGKKIVTASWDGTAKVWGVDEDGAWVCVTTLEGHTEWVYSAAFSLDGKKIVTASRDKTAKVWSVNEAGVWECVATLEGSSGWVRSAKFRFDGTQIVTASGDGAARVWVVGEYGVWDCVATLEGHARCVCSSEFSPDGEKVITASTDGKARICDISFLNKPLTLSQLLFVVLAKKHPECFENLSEGWVGFFSEIWRSFAPQMQQHLKSKISQIDFNFLESIDDILPDLNRLSS